MLVASEREPGNRPGRPSWATRSGLRYTSRNQPPSGWAASPSARISATASALTAGESSAAGALGERRGGALGVFLVGVLVVVIVVLFVLVVALELVVVVFLIRVLGVRRLERVAGDVHAGRVGTRVLARRAARRLERKRHAVRVELQHLHLLRLARRDERAQLLGTGELGEVLQPEVVEEVARRAVEERPADHGRAALDRDQRALEQRRERAARVDAADRLDLALRHRLLVRDDRERLERGAREAHLALAAQHPRHPLVLLRRRGDDPAAGHLAQLDAGLARLVVGAERGQSLAD